MPAQRYEKDGADEIPKPVSTRYSWKELALHNTENDCWVAVDGCVYDVTSWLPKHPGGKDTLLSAAGRDVTNLFESYHPLTTKPTAVLSKYYIGNLADDELPRYVTKSAFYATLKERIRDYFQTNNIDPQSGWRVWTRLLSIYALLAVFYYLTHFYASNIVTALGFAVCFGISEALFGLHILHDTCHASVSHNPMVWRWMGSTFDWFVGASYYSWIHQHVLGHHIYTNVRNADPDLGEGDVDFRRVSPFQPRLWFHKYQHIYAPLLYGLLTFKFRMQDVAVFTARMNGRIRVGPAPLFYLLAFITGKTSFIVTRFVLPYFLSPYLAYSFSTIALLFVAAELVVGYYLAINFQVSHVADGLEFTVTPAAPAEVPTPIQDDWAEMQVRTTQDYAHNDPITTFLAGALNYQVVHHLFPSINQTYYPEIAPIVIKTCKEFGVNYQVLPNFYSAVSSHINYLKYMGSSEAPVLPVPENAVNGEWYMHPAAPSSSIKPISVTTKPAAPLRRSARRSSSQQKGRPEK